MAKQLPYSTIHEIFSRFRETEAEPKGELEHVNAYTLVVAVALSAQATEPSSRAALQSLPGVGRKTANVVLNMWFKHPAQAVDTHIFRVGNRTGIAPGKDVAAVERAIEDHIPAEFQQHAHHWLILHGRYTCVARKPKCNACLIRDLCEYEDKTE
jgi:endonuclease III